MTVIDAAGLISFFTDEPAAAQVEELLKQPGAAMTALNLAEVLDTLERVRRYLPDELLDAVEQLVSAGLAVLSVEHEDGRDAGQLRASYYHSRTCPVSMADCVLLACVSNRGAQLATSDAALVQVAHRLALEVVPLPNSAGRLP